MDKVETLYQQRINICQGCEWHRPALNRCGSCGCFLSLKARIPWLDCPEGKWGPLDINTLPTEEEVEQAIQPYASHPEELMPDFPGMQEANPKYRGCNPDEKNNPA